MTHYWVGYEEKSVAETKFLNLCSLSSAPPEALPKLWKLGLVDPRCANFLVAAIEKVLRVGERVRLVVCRLTIVACLQAVPIGNIKPARIACIPIIVPLGNIGMRGIDALGRRHTPNLWNALSPARVRHHFSSSAVGSYLLRLP
jgi:hypothetical protein